MTALPPPFSLFCLVMHHFSLCICLSISVSLMEQGDRPAVCFTTAYMHTHKQLHTHANRPAEWIAEGIDMRCG